jgi:predicted RND superfamily exporter protein
MDDLPEPILDRYSNRDRDKFIITVYPTGDLWQKQTLKRFVDDIERVTDEATGAPLLGDALIKIFGRDGRNAMLLTLVIVFLLLSFDFRSFRYALSAMVPLALGIFWMLGFMNIVGMNLSIMNVMGLPMIIGIGIDDGVHIMHRWRYEGLGKIRVIFSSTGKAIFLTSLTTMFAFGSMIFSGFPGWVQFGGTLALGVGTCFITTVIILPGILGLIEKRNSIKISSK